MWNEIKEFVGIGKILELLSELPRFYFKPKLFFQYFFQKENKEKVIQLVVYSFFIILLGYVSIEDADWKFLIKALLYETFALITLIIVLWLANRATALLGGKRIETEDIVLFSILIKLLIAPFQILFFGLFIFHENYNYFFIQNLVILLLYFYYLVFSSYIFQDKLKFVVANIVANILILNIILGVQKLVSIDNYYASESPYTEDQILKERVDLGKDISDYYSVPSHRILYKMKEGNLSHFLITHPLDTISRGNFEESESYHKSLKEKIPLLDSMIEQSNFIRNQEFFKETKSLYISIDSLMDKKVIEYTSKDIEKNTVHMSSDSKMLYNELHIRTPDYIQINAYKLLEQQIDLERNSYYAFLPLIISEYFVPIFLLFEKDKNDT